MDSEQRLISSRVPEATPLPPCAPSSRAEVDDVVPLAAGLLVVLYHQDGIAAVFHLPERCKQHPVVPGMQADGGLIQDIADPPQVGAELDRQAYPLRLPTREGIHATVQRQIGEPHPVEELELAHDLFDDPLGDGYFSLIEAEFTQHARRILYCEGGEITDAPALYLDSQRGFLEALPFTQGALLLSPIGEEIIEGSIPLEAEKEMFLY